jgi:hypothetical protein
VFDDLRQKQAEPACCCVDQRGVAGLDGIKVSGEVTGGETLHHDGGGRPVVDLVGNSDERVEGGGDAFGVAAGDVDPCDAIARLEAIISLVDVDDAAGALDAEDFGKGISVQNIPCRTPMSMKFTPEAATSTMAPSGAAAGCCRSTASITSRPPTPFITIALMVSSFLD